MEKETKKLHALFMKEKKEFQEQLVAEPKRGIWRVMNAKIIMIVALNGGVGKSVSTFNLAYSLKKMEKKVLAVGFDSQANLSTCYGVENAEAVPVTIGDLMMAMMDEEKLLLIRKNPFRQGTVWILFHHL